MENLISTCRYLWFRRCAALHGQGSAEVRPDTVGQARVVVGGDIGVVQGRHLARVCQGVELPLVDLDSQVEAVAGVDALGNEQGFSEGDNFEIGRSKDISPFLEAKEWNKTILFMTTK